MTSDHPDDNSAKISAKFKSVYDKQNVIDIRGKSCHTHKVEPNSDILLGSRDQYK